MALKMIEFEQCFGLLIRKQELFQYPKTIFMWGTIRRQGVSILKNVANRISCEAQNACTNAFEVGDF